VTETKSTHKILVEKLGCKIHLCPKRKYNIELDLKELVAKAVLIWMGVTGSSGVL
jgi:hypothetical protein